MLHVIARGIACNEPVAPSGGGDVLLVDAATLALVRSWRRKPDATGAAASDGHCDEGHYDEPLCAVRMLTWLPGRLMADVPQVGAVLEHGSEQQRFASGLLGSLLATAVETDAGCRIDRIIYAATGG